MNESLISFLNALFSGVGVIFYLWFWGIRGKVEKTCWGREFGVGVGVRVAGVKMQLFKYVVI